MTTKTFYKPDVNLGATHEKHTESGPKRKKNNCAIYFRSCFSSYFSLSTYSFDQTTLKNMESKIKVGQTFI